MPQDFHFPESNLFGADTKPVASHHQEAGKQPADAAADAKPASLVAAETSDVVMATDMKGANPGLVWGIDVPVDPAPEITMKTELPPPSSVGVTNPSTPSAAVDAKPLVATSANIGQLKMVHKLQV